jgi:kynurenine formamidase
MRIVDLSMTVEECDSAPFAPDETYFKIKPYINWDEKGFVSNFVHMTVHAGTHIDSPHHFFRDKPSIERLPLEPLIGNGVVLDLTFKGSANARITPEDLDRAEQELAEHGVKAAFCCCAPTGRKGIRRPIPSGGTIRPVSPKKPRSGW